MFVSWRRALKRIWELPISIHADIIYSLSGKCPIEIEIKHRILRFSFSCINSDNYLVRIVARHSIFFMRSYSGLGFNFFHCCLLFNIIVAVPDFCFNLNAIPVLRSIKDRISSGVVDNFSLIYELIMLRDNICTLSNNLCLDKLEVRSILNYLCTV